MASWNFVWAFLGYTHDTFCLIVSSFLTVHNMGEWLEKGDKEWGILFLPWNSPIGGSGGRGIVGGAFKLTA